MKGSGRRRQEIPQGTIIGNFKIIRRTEQLRGRPGDNQEYFYVGECLVCSEVRVKRMHNFRMTGRFHHGCPAHKMPEPEVAAKINLGQGRQELDGPYVPSAQPKAGLNV